MLVGQSRRFLPRPIPLADIEDIIQETMIKIADYWHTGKFHTTDPGAFRGFAILVAHSRAVSYLRKEFSLKRDQGRTESLAAAAELADSDSSKDPAASVALGEAFKSLLRRLEPLDRDLVLLGAAGYSFAERAEELGINPRTVSRHLESIERLVNEAISDSD